MCACASVPPALTPRYLLALHNHLNTINYYMMADEPRITNTEIGFPDRADKEHQLGQKDKNFKQVLFIKLLNY